MSLPLDGQLVVALEQAVAAPFCTSRLADAGARVIKVERAEGDFARGYDDVVDGESSYFVWLNRGKESICLDIKDEVDKALLLRLLAQADIFVQNLAPGAAERAGLGADDLLRQNERLIALDITGYGAEGAYRDMKAYDLLIQCESGLASVTGSPDAPGRVGVSISDIACGMFAYAAILEALIERRQTGVGKCLHVSLFDSVADWMTVPLLHQEYSGHAPPRVGISHPSIAPYGAYSTKDGLEVVIAVQNDREWSLFCETVLRNPACAESDLYSSNVARCANRASMDAEIDAVFSTLTREDILGRLQEAGIAFGSVNRLDDVLRHPQLRRTAVRTPSGEVRLIAPPATDAGAGPRLRPAPALGEHTDSIRAEFVA